MAENSQGFHTYTSQVLSEKNQDHQTRVGLYEELEEKLGAKVVSFYTSFNYNVMMEDTDAQMLDDLLQTIDLSDGLFLMINSPGGSALAAERMINICRAYSGTGDYRVIVPEQAKSAASLVSLGAQQIIASETSELGPVDPQLPAREDAVVNRYSVNRLVNGYHDLFDRAISTDGPLEPYLQQLDNYDERDINELESQVRLSEEIAVQALQESMMEDKDSDEIRECIEIFLNPDEMKVHGRPIYTGAMERCGLNVDIQDVNNDLWETITELHVRLNQFVSDQASKCIESSGDSYVIPAP